MSSKTTAKKKKVIIKAVMGQPPKREDEKILTNHLRPDQWRRMEEEAAIRNKSTWAFIRDLIDWGITALDTKRGDSDAAKLFDGVDNEGGNV